MIVSSKAMGFYPIKNQTIEELLESQINTFSHRLLRVYDKQFKSLSLEEQQKFQDITPIINANYNDMNMPLTKSSLLPDKICSIQNYNVFNEANLEFDYIKTINYNSKDIKYSELYTRLWDNFKFYLEDYQKKFNSEYENTVGCKQFDIYPVENYHYFFSGGEFPFLDFKIVRIGNNEYVFSQIVR